MKYIVENRSDLSGQQALQLVASAVGHVSSDFARLYMTYATGRYSVTRVKNLRSARYIIEKVVR